jgi:4-hydroxy-tetrahydrodipicolinate synthase
MKIPNVTMVKESAFDVTRYHKIRALAGPDAWFYNGTNSLALGAFAAGAQGWCTSAAHVIPHKTLALYEAAVVTPDLRKAAAIFDDQFSFLEFLVKMGIPRVIAAALDDMGTDVGPLRAPLLPLAEKDRATLKRLLREVGAIN